MEKLEDILALVLKIGAKDINDETSPQNTPSWDSMNGLLIVTEVEKNYGIKFTIDDILSIKNVGKIKEILAKHNLN